MNALLIEQIRLFQYKNYQEISLQFQPQLNAIVGRNGIGKTNLLDAIYTMSFTKSYFSKNETFYLKHLCNACKIEAKYQLHDEKFLLDLTIRENNKKEMNVNGKAIKKYSEFIGTLPIVMICPDDISLINELAEERRSFLDKFISQVNHVYLEALIQYNKILLQKHTLLKNWQTQANPHLLDVYHQQLEPLAYLIFEQRKVFSERLIAYAKQYYHFIADHQYDIGIRYDSQLLRQSWQELLQKYSAKECEAQRNLIGIQKDDIVFELTHHSFKESASQGQKKTLLLAMKMASLKIIAEEKKVHPILLLDDIFEKLDHTRLQRLFMLLSQFFPMQIFLTDVSKQRVESILNQMQLSCNFIEIGETTPTE